MNNIFGLLGKAITLFIAMHFYFSYLLICKQLELFGISPASHVTLEDVTYSYGDISSLIFSYAITGIIVIVIFRMLFYLFPNLQIPITRKNLTLGLSIVIPQFRDFTKKVFKDKKERT